MTSKPLFLLAVAGSLIAQTTGPNLSAGACSAAPGAPNKVRVLAFVPTVVGTVTVTVPFCVGIGAGFTVNTTIPGAPTLEYTPPAPPPVPHMVAEKVAFGTTIPATQTTLPWTLARTPAPGTMIIAVLKSSTGQNVVDIVDFNSTTPKAVTITLPTYRPFTTDDAALLQYWTLEP